MDTSLLEHEGTRPTSAKCEACEDSDLNFKLFESIRGKHSKSHL
jgi:hypothetical protein